MLNGTGVELDVEYMDSKRFVDETSRQAFYEYLAYKLANLPPYDVIIVSDDNAFNFAMKHQVDLFANLPIVFLGTNNVKWALEQNLNPFVTGVVEAVSMRETLQLMVQLQPNLKTVYVVVDGTPSGQGDLETFYEASDKFKAVTFVELSLTGLTFDELVQTLQQLDDNSAVLLLSAYHDSTGRRVEFDESLALITQNLSAPLYHLWYHGMGQGVLGGKLISHEEQGRVAAEMALQIIRGRSPADIRIVEESPNRYMFDYNQLTRFGISKANLPTDSIIINQPVTFYSQYKHGIWTTGIVFIMLLGFIGGLIANIISRRRAENALRRRNSELNLLNRVIAASAAEPELIPLLETVCRELALAFQLPQAAAALIDDDETTAQVVAEYLDQGRPPAMNQIIPVMGNESYQYLISNKVPLIINDSQNSSMLKSVESLVHYRQTGSLLLIPLIVNNKVVGSLGLDALKPDYFSPESAALAQNVARQVSGALARAQLAAEQKDLQERYYQAQKIEALGRLTGGVAHDFNNLLTDINGFAELLQMQLTKNPLEFQMAGNILQAGQRAASLVGQLLAFSRKQIVEPEIINLNEVLAKLEQMLKPIIGEHITLLFYQAKNLGMIKIAPTQMEQVIINLAVNSRDAMPEGGQLSLSTANVFLNRRRIKADNLELEPGHHVKLTVTDTGAGMLPEITEHIFEPFFTTKEVGKGTGLGLATVYGIVKQNKGDIQVKSQVGHGASFCIYLPRVDEVAPSPQTSSSAEADFTGNETILLVEDDVTVRSLILRVLQSKGYDVVEAADGQDALEKAAAYPPQNINLLLTDVVMPNVNGKKLAQLLLNKHPGLKVIFMSGYTGHTLAQYDISETEATFIQKPVSPIALLQTIRHALDGELEKM